MTTAANSSAFGANDGPSTRGRYVPRSLHSFNPQSSSRGECPVWISRSDGSCRCHHLMPSSTMRVKPAKKSLCVMMDRHSYKLRLIDLSSQSISSKNPTGPKRYSKPGESKVRGYQPTLSACRMIKESALISRQPQPTNATVSMENRRIVYFYCSIVLLYFIWGTDPNRIDASRLK